MLFWIFVAVMVVGAVLMAIDSVFDVGEWCEVTGGVALILGGICVVVSLFVFAGVYISADGYISEMNAKREVLVYQLENDVYDSDNNIGMRDLMEDIRKYNQEVAGNREMQDDFWVGIYIPDIYDQIELIDLNKTVEVSE